MAEQLNTATVSSSTGSSSASGSTGSGTRLAERPAQAAERAAVTHGSSTSSTTPGTGTKPIPFAAVSFVSGLVGLLVANLVLGPLAIVLGVVGLRVDKNRRVRAALGILLGAADIAVFLILAAHSAHHGSVSWNFFSN